MWVPGRPLLMLHRVQPNHVDEILNALDRGHLPPAELVLCKIEDWDHITGHVKYGYGYPDVPAWNQIPFFDGQVKIVLRNCGLINPDDIEEYIAIGGYQALYKVLIDQNPAGVIEQVKAAKLRGRGGAGYLTGNKWEFLQKAAGPEKYLVCNADEGDPGAYMNRNEIESDPHALLEGMLIAGYVTGAPRGIIYVRAEYPLAVLRLERAIEQARAYGVLGDNVLGRGFNFEIETVEGAGAFVCGEETALIASLEGQSGRPRSRPPFPAQKGLYGKPTNINNVETWYNIAPIVSKGPAWFTETGSAKSAGTKVFSLVGQGAAAPGLVEMPLGTPLAKFIYDIGGGTSDGRDIKAVQTGGPSGGCIPADMFDTPVDYETLAQLGSIMGSGGMVVMDQDNCMVDVARYFIEFTHSESCGKCVPCRVGLDKALRMLNRFTVGKAAHEDIATLDELCRMVRDTSLCGLGQSAPNPVLTSLRHFRHEFEDHIVAKRCRAGVCEDLALSPCENSCPAAHEHPALPAAVPGGQAGGRVPLGDRGQPAAGLHRARLPAPLRQPLPPCRPGRGGEHARRAPPDRGRGAALRPVRDHRGARARAQARADRARGRDRRRRPDRPRLRLLPRALRPQRDGLRLAPRRRRHAPLRAAGVPAAEGGAGQGDRADRAPGCPVPVQRQRRRGHHAQRRRPPVRRGLPRDRHLEGGLGLPARAPSSRA